MILKVTNEILKNNISSNLYSVTPKFEWTNSTFDNCNYRTFEFQTKTETFSGLRLTCSMLLIQLDQFRDFTFIGGDGRFNGSRGVVNFDHDTAPVGIANAVYYIRIIPQ